MLLCSTVKPLRVSLVEPVAYLKDSYNMFIAFMIAPVFQIVNIGTQLTEAFAGLDRTSEIMAELEENRSPRCTVKIPPIQGTVRFEDVEFAYEPGKPVLHGISFLAEPGTVRALVGSSGSGKSTIISLLCAFHTPTKGRVWVDDGDLSRVDLNTFRSQLAAADGATMRMRSSVTEQAKVEEQKAMEAPPPLPPLRYHLRLGRTFRPRPPHRWPRSWNLRNLPLQWSRHGSRRLRRRK